MLQRAKVEAAKTRGDILQEVFNNIPGAVTDVGHIGEKQTLLHILCYSATQLAYTLVRTITSKVSNFVTHWELSFMIMNDPEQDVTQFFFVPFIFQIQQAKPQPCPGGAGRAALHGEPLRGQAPRTPRPA